MPQLHRDGPVWIIDFGADENRFSPDWLDSLDALLDDLVASAEPAALVTTATGKFFSNGLDLEWVAARFPGDREALARTLGIGRRTLFRKLRQLGSGEPPES